MSWFVWAAESTWEGWNGFATDHHHCCSVPLQIIPVAARLTLNDFITLVYAQCVSVQGAAVRQQPCWPYKDPTVHKGWLSAAVHELACVACRMLSTMA